ncbi:MAG: hypothetical protein ACO24W_02105 [Candidatus Nanopelagicales bacterium]
MSTSRQSNQVSTVWWILSCIAALVWLLSRCEPAETIKFSSNSTLKTGPVAEAALSEVRDFYPDTNVYDQDQYRTFYDPAIPQEVRDIFEENHQTFFKRVEFEIRRPLINIIYTDSKDWALQQIKTMYGANSSGTYNASLEFQDGAFFDQKSCSSKDAIGIFLDYWDIPLIVVSVECGWSDGTSQKYQKGFSTTVIHELAHFLQSNWDSYEQNSCRLPLWFSEGQASFIASSMSKKNGSYIFQAARNTYISYDLNGRLQDNEFESSDVGEYSDGALAIEYLVGTYGWQSVRDVENALAKMSPSLCSKVDAISYFNRAFLQTYGMNLEKFYEVYRKYALSLR